MGTKSRLSGAVHTLGNPFSSQKKAPPPAALPAVRQRGAMKIRVVHENKAADLVMMDGETVGGLRRNLHGIFKINLDRIEIWHNDRQLNADATTLVNSGVGEGSVLQVTISAPKVVAKAAPATPAEALANEDAEVSEIKDSSMTWSPWSPNSGRQPPLARRT